MIAVLGLLALVSGALLPAAAQEQTTNQITESFLASTSPAVSPDVSVSSAVTDFPTASSLAADHETLDTTERPEIEVLSSTSAQPADTATDSEETAASPSGTLPGPDTGHVTSANPTSVTASTRPSSPTAGGDIASETRAGLAVTPSLISILTSATATPSTEPPTDPTEQSATSSNVHSTLMTAITTTLFITTTVTTKDATGPTADSAAARRTSMAVKMEPSVLEVGDEKELPNYHNRNSSNPLFVMIVSIFTVMVVIVVVVVGFHRYKKRNSRTEFRRLQDLPMDDMMEDTPLSLYSY